VIRIEDLFRDPREEIHQMFHFLELERQEDLEKWIFENINDHVYNDIVSWRQRQRHFTLLEYLLESSN